MDNVTLILIIAVPIVAIIVGGYFLKRLMMRGIDAGMDAVRNEKARKRELENPPQQQSLAEKYGNTYNNQGK